MVPLLHTCMSPRHAIRTRKALFCDPVFICLSVRFYPRDPMLAQYMLSSRVRPSVHPSVPTEVGVLRRWLNPGSRKQRYTIAQGLKFSDAKDLGEIPTESPLTRAPNGGAVGSNRRFLTNISLYLRNGTR